MIYYISGKITNGGKDDPTPTFERFNNKEQELLAQGHQVFNPISREKEGRTWEEYLAYDVLFIMQQRPVMYMMRGWQESLGARLEHELACLLRLQIVYE